MKTIKEDQYKTPTGNMRRIQSPFRSSFGKSKSFGGVTKNGVNTNKKSTK